MLSIPPMSTTGMALSPTIADIEERAPKLEIMMPAMAIQAALMAHTIKSINRASMPKAMALAWLSDVARMARPQRVRNSRKMIRPNVHRESIPAQMGSERKRSSPYS